VVGLYSLWVKRGRVSLLGATLEASSTLHHVFVPVTHAIPSITATHGLAELVISMKENGIRYLGDISRHFAGIWEPTFISTTLSFHVVSFDEICGLCSLLMQLNS
jgi:polynucleotide 5'-hydroxyl-kinase GRC3/NOL9